MNLKRSEIKSRRTQIRRSCNEKPRNASNITVQCKTWAEHSDDDVTRKRESERDEYNSNTRVLTQLEKQLII